MGRKNKGKGYYADKKQRRSKNDNNWANNLLRELQNNHKMTEKNH